jgi:hypothetical protein
MPETCEWQSKVRVDINYLRGVYHVQLQNPYTISDSIYFLGKETGGKRRLSVQHELWGMDARPPTLFEELNAAAGKCRDAGPGIPSADEIEAVRKTDMYSLWLDHLLIGAGTPAKGTQDGIGYAIDYTAGGGLKCFFAGDKAKSALIMTGWEGRYSEWEDRWLIEPGHLFELPREMRTATSRYDLGDVDPETGFIKKTRPEGRFFAWMTNGPELTGLRPVTINAAGDVSAVWNLDDKAVFVATRMVNRE